MSRVGQFGSSSVVNRGEQIQTEGTHGGRSVSKFDEKGSGRSSDVSRTSNTQGMSTNRHHTKRDVEKNSTPITSWGRFFNRIKDGFCNLFSTKKADSHKQSDSTVSSFADKVAMLEADKDSILQLEAKKRDMSHEEYSDAKFLAISNLATTMFEISQLLSEPGDSQDSASLLKYAQELFELGYSTSKILNDLPPEIRASLKEHSTNLYKEIEYLVEKHYANQNNQKPVAPDQPTVQSQPTVQPELNQAGVQGSQQVQNKPYEFPKNPSFKLLNGSPATQYTKCSDAVVNQQAKGKKLSAMSALNRVGISTIDVPGDGHCGFWALQVLKGEKEPSAQKVIDLRENAGFNTQKYYTTNNWGAPDSDYFDMTKKGHLIAAKEYLGEDFLCVSVDKDGKLEQITKLVNGDVGYPFWDKDQLTHDLIPEGTKMLILVDGNHFVAGYK